MQERFDAKVFSSQGAFDSYISLKPGLKGMIVVIIWFPARDFRLPRCARFAIIFRPMAGFQWIVINIQITYNFMKIIGVLLLASL